MGLKNPQARHLRRVNFIQDNKTSFGNAHHGEITPGKSRWVFRAGNCTSSAFAQVLRNHSQAVPPAPNDVLLAALRVDVGPVSPALINMHVVLLPWGL